MWAVVLLIGVPSAWRNPTAAALVGAWVVTKTLYLVTGDGLALEFYIFPDIAVMAIIFMKPRYQPRSRYADDWHRFKCLLLERTPADRVVMLIYPIEWVLYVTTLPAREVWFALWGLSIIQFLAAGAEPLAQYLRRRGADATVRPPDHPGSPLLVACRLGGVFG